MSTAPPHQSLKNLLPEQIGAACLMLGFALYTVWDQLFWWGNREDYSFGYLVPFFVGYVLFDRWPRIRSYLFTGTALGEVPSPAGEASSPAGEASSPAGEVPSPAAPAGGAPSAAPDGSASAWVRLLEGLAVAAFVGSLLLFAVGALLRAATGPQNPASLAIAASLGGLVLSGVFIFAKQRVDGQPMPLRQRLALTALFLFPAFIWLLSAPMVSVLETQIRVFLLNKVTIVVFGLFDFLGFELSREGNVLILPDGQVGVEEACSGIRSLTACLFAGSFLAAVFLDRFWKKVLLVAAAMVFAVITNLLRSLFLTYYAYNNGSQSIDDDWVLPILGNIGTVHDVTGMAILGVTCVGLISLLPIFNYKLSDMDEEDFIAAPPPSQPPQPPESPKD